MKRSTLSNTGVFESFGRFIGLKCHNYAQYLRYIYVYIYIWIHSFTINQVCNTSKFVFMVLQNFFILK